MDQQASAPDPVATPLAVIVAAVGRLEPGLGATAVGEAVEQVAPSRRKRRHLARVLAADPAVLSDGRSTMPRAVEELVRALVGRGATGMALPRCGVCGQTNMLHGRRGPQRICSGCAGRLRQAACGKCGHHRQVAYRDRHGQPRCKRCPPQDSDNDAVAAVLSVVVRLDPALPAEAATVAIWRAAPSRTQRRRLAWALDATPELLTGTGARGPRVVLVLIDELQRVGVTGVVRPACPGCDRVVRLYEPVDGQRLCRRCHLARRVEPCARCGAVRAPSARDPQGRPRCVSCQHRDPANFKHCTLCDRSAPVTARTAQGPVCSGCYRPPTGTCSQCGRQRPCTKTRTGLLRCGTCARLVEPCVRCGRHRPVNVRRPDGPWCSTCYKNDPDSTRQCLVCGATGDLYEKRRCGRCVLAQRLQLLLGGGTGTIRAELEPLYQALVAVELPRVALNWLANSKAKTILAEVGRGERVLSHAALDALVPATSIDHLRAVLVASGCLPARDEQLVRLERWAHQQLSSMADADEQRLVRAYVTWQLLRRLRHRVRGQPTTPEQAIGVQGRVRAVIRLLAWLRADGRTLATCRQPDLDRWLAIPGSRHADDFLRWALARRHAAGLKVPQRDWRGPHGNIDSDQRWQLARRLLTDTTIEVVDRVAGLLVVLYAQSLAAIVRLTIDHVTTDNGDVRLQLGQAPVLLVEPLAGLLGQLAAVRKGHATVGHPGTSPWLLPGGRPGHPLGSKHLSVRLNRLGIAARQNRSAALLQLAAKLPAAVLARLLGISTYSAAAWQRTAGGDWAGYAAQLGRRAHQQAAGRPDAG